MTSRPCSCGKRILNPVPIAIQHDRGVPLLILWNCPACGSTRGIPWHMASEETRKAAQDAHLSRDAQSEMMVGRAE